MNLRELSDPHGAGVVIAFWACLVAGIAASVTAPLIFRPPAVRYRVTIQEAVYTSCTVVTFVSLLLMVTYLPDVVKEPDAAQRYAPLANLCMWLGHACGLATVALICHTYNVWFRRDSKWHRPFVWLVGAQAAMGLYTANTAYARMEAYDLLAWDARRDETSGLTYGLTLGLGLVFMAVAAVNYYLVFWAARAARPGKVRRPHAKPHMYDKMTWLDWLVAGMASVHGVVPPFPSPRPPDDEDPDDPTGNTRNIIDRT